MKNFFLTFLAPILKQVGVQVGEAMLQKAASALQSHIDQHTDAIDQLHTEVFARADENDKLLAQVAANRAANDAAISKIQAASATVDRLNTLVNG